jgi:hypothetical protein
MYDPKIFFYSVCLLNIPRCIELYELRWGNSENHNTDVYEELMYLVKLVLGARALHTFPTLNMASWPLLTSPCSGRLSDAI